MQRRNFILKLAQIFAILWPLFTTGRFFMRLSAYQFAYDYSPRPHRVELHRLILKQLEKLKRETGMKGGKFKQQQKMVLNRLH